MSAIYRSWLNLAQASHLCIAAGLWYLWASMILRNTALTIFGAASLLAVTGCGGGSTEETSAAGRTATVEFRPAVVGLDKTIQKQRSGKLIKVTTEWVVIDENGAEIWVPRDMVLEIRMGG